MKQLGQYFLKNRKILRRIIKALNLTAGETVIEIGSGHGELTDELKAVNRELQIITIEKDEFLVKKLKEKYGNNKNIKIINADVLKILPALTKELKSKTKNYKLIGNIPYYLTGRLLRIVSELELKPILTVLTVQKEVAERICAKPPAMNLLAASVQFWAEPEIVFYLTKKDFWPMPKVDSAVIKLKTLKNQPLNAEKYYALIKILFKQPRKTILNNLLAAQLAGRAALIVKLEQIKINPYNRPQNLALNQLKLLTKMLYN